MSILDQEILNLQGNSWTVRDAACGTMCFGMTGSGKSSGPLRSIALRFLELKFGGIVFCAKPDECETWEGYARETGRSNDLIKLSRETFAFLNYELERPQEAGGGQIENVVGIFLEVTKIGKDKRNGSTNDEYWQNAIKQFLRNTISLLLMAGEAITLPNIKQTIDTTIKKSAVAEGLKKYFKEFRGYCAQYRDMEFYRRQDSTGYEEILNRFEEEYKKNNGDVLNAELLNAAHEYSSTLISKAIYYGKCSGPDYELGFNYF